MHTGTISKLVIGALALAATSAAAAEGPRKGCVELKTVAETEVEYVDEQGQRATKLVPATKVIPGTQVVWTVTASNICDKVADRVFIDNPIPAQMSYVSESAIGAGADILFSTDGRQFADPASLRVSDSAGSQRAARSSDYTHIRWSLRNPIGPGQVAVARYRAALK